MVMPPSPLLHGGITDAVDSRKPSAMAIRFFLELYLKVVYGLMPEDSEEGGGDFCWTI